MPAFPALGAKKGFYNFKGLQRKTKTSTWQRPMCGLQDLKLCSLAEVLVYSKLFLSPCFCCPACGFAGEFPSSLSTRS